MTRNQLPEGVGKKIVEALKRQAEADISPLEESNNNVGNSIPLTDIEENEEIKFNSLLEENENMIIEEEIPFKPKNSADINQKSNDIGIKNINVDVNQPIENKVQESVNRIETVRQATPSISAQVAEPKQPQREVPKAKEQTTEPTAFTFAQTQEVKKEPMVKVPQSIVSSVRVNIPSNVAVLKNLIASLPVGVSKQTGAQIIRQTLEAMGIPMNSVLKEAQEVQEELNSSTRECMIKIQEYKSQILQLDQTVQYYQQNVTQINDLVSLFLLTDKK